MSTNKNTFRYLCFVFAFALIHFFLRRLDYILSFVFFAACIFYGAHCTGFPKLYKKPYNIIATVLISFWLAIYIPVLERLALDMLHIESGFFIHPSTELPGQLISIAAALILCKLASFGTGMKFPRGLFLLACFIPALFYFMLGLCLSLTDVAALEPALFKLRIGIYSGRMVLLYNDELPLAVRDITIGWSIFCMMKYNQSMKIKALFEMQAKM